jgi:acid phosphatase (class A)
MQITARLIPTLLFALISTQTVSAQSDGKLHFLNANVLAELRQSLPSPPAQNSKEQTADEMEIRRIQAARKPVDCDRAASEIEATLGNFYGQPNGPLNQTEVERLDDFFKLLRNEAGAFIGKLKEIYPRQRPYQYLKGIETCIKQETSNSYPSGHAIFAELYSRVLVDLFPDKKQQIQQRSEVIGRDRVVTGLHHPSDVAGGRSVGRKIYEELKKSKAYRDAFERARKSLHH